MKKSLLRTTFRIAKWIVLFVIFITLILVVLHWQTNIVSKAVEYYINHSLEGQASISYRDIKGGLINHVRIEELEVRVGELVLIKTDYLDIQYQLWPLLDNEIIISSLIMDNLDVYYSSTSDTIEEVEKGSFNLDAKLAMLERLSIVDTLLAALPVVHTEKLEIRTGSLNLLGEDSLSVQDLDLQLSLHLDKDKVDLRFLRFSASIPAYQLRLRNLSFQLIGDYPQFTINQFKLETDESEVLFSGDIVVSDSVQMLLSLDRFYLSFPELNKFLHDENLQEGYLSGRAGIYGAPRYFNTQWSISGMMMGEKVDSLILDADYEYGMIKVITFKLVSDQNFASFEGMLDLRKTVEESTGLWGDLRVKKLDLSLIPEQNISSYINGHLKFRLENLNFKHPTGTGELLIYKTVIDSIRIDSLRFGLTAESGDYLIREPSFVKFNDQVTFDLNGKMDRNRLVDLRLKAENGDLLRFSQAFAMDSLRGSFDASLRATGYLFDPDIAGYLWVTSFDYDDILLDSTALELDVHRILSKREGFIKFLIDSGSVYQMPVNDVRAHAELDSHIINISQVGFRSEENYLTSALELRFLPDTVMATMEYFRIKYADYYLENQGPLLILADTLQISFEQFRLEGPSNTELEVMGFWDMTAGDLQLFIDLENVALQPFDQFLGSEHRIDGFLEGTIELITPLHDPVMDVDIRARELSYNDVKFGRVISIFQMAEQKILINKLQVNDGESTLDLTGDLALTLDFEHLETMNFLEQTKAELKINWNDIDLSKYASLLEAEKNLKGRLSGYLETEGTVNEPFIRQSLRLEGFRYDDIQIDSLVMFGQYSSGYLIVDSLSATLNETDFALKGWQKYDLKLDSYDSTFTSKPFEFILTSVDDQMRFIGLFNEQLESIEGAYEMELYLGGTPEHPAISQGFFRLDNGELLLSLVKDPIRNVNLDASIEDSVLTINHFSGYSKKKKSFLDRIIGLFEKGVAFLKGKSTEEGLITAEGTILLNDVNRPRMDISVEMQQLFVDYFIENITAVLNTEQLAVSGRDTLFVTGELVIPKGRYEVDLSQMQKNIYLSAPQAEITPPYLSLDMDVLIPGNFEVSSSPLDLANNFKITMEGELGVMMEPGEEDPKIMGHLRTVSGKYSSWNQNFEVETGSIVFTNPDEINPDIELVAEKRISRYTVQLIVGGNLEKQTYDLNVLDKDGSQVPMSMPEKLSLLTLGADLSQVTSKSDSTLLSVGEDVATTSVLTAVERGAETFTGLDKVEINSDDKILDLQKMKLNNGLQDASISFGKYLTSDLYVEYRTGFGELGSGIPTPRLSWDAGNRIGLQYRINREWALDSFYEKTLRGSKIKIGLAWEYTF